MNAKKEKARGFDQQQKQIKPEFLLTIRVNDETINARFESENQARFLVGLIPLDHNGLDSITVYEIRGMTLGKLIVKYG